MRYTKRKLKHWLIMGTTCNTRADHHKQKKDVDNWCVPNEDDLDDQMKLALPMGREETDCEFSRRKVLRNNKRSAAGEEKLALEDIEFTSDEEAASASDSAPKSKSSTSSD